MKKPLARMKVMGKEFAELAVENVRFVDD